MEGQNVVDGLHRVVRNGVQIEFRLGADDDPKTVENVDAVITAPGGDRWGATLLTIGEIERILARWSRSGEAAGGLYLRVPDLVLMSVPGIEQMAAAIFDMLENGGQLGLTPVD